MLHREFSVPTALDTHPKHDVALGSVRVGHDETDTLTAAPDEPAPPTRPERPPHGRAGPGPTAAPSAAAAAGTRGGRLAAAAPDPPVGAHRAAAGGDAGPRPGPRGPPCGGPPPPPTGGAAPPWAPPTARARRRPATAARPPGAGPRSRGGAGRGAAGRRCRRRHRAARPGHGGRARRSPRPRRPRPVVGTGVPLGHPTPAPSATPTPSSPPDPFAGLPASAPLDDQVIVWPRVRDGNWDVALLDLRTDKETRLTKGETIDWGPVISANRRTIMYTRIVDDRPTTRVMARGRHGRPAAVRPAAEGLLPAVAAPRCPRAGGWWSPATPRTRRADGAAARDHPRRQDRPASWTRAGSATRP